MNKTTDSCCASVDDDKHHTSNHLPVDEDQLRQGVRESYARVAELHEDQASGCCVPTAVGTACCGDAAMDEDFSLLLGYSKEELMAVPQGANMGLGCGNPQAIAALRPGEVVIDLGSGGGFDCFLASPHVGDDGQVIGIDMTAEMISKARANAKQGDFGNVEFRLGEIEYLPVADNSADVIISNCVINLSPNKPQVFREAMRVLKPGGRLAISDVVATTHFPEEIANDLTLYSGCISGASPIDELEAMMAAAGFNEIRIQAKDDSKRFIREWVPGSKVDDYVVSASIEAIKP